MMFVALLLTSLITSCQRKPLYLVPHGNVSIATAEYDLQLNVLWGADWQREWQYPWIEDKYGPLGYTHPTGVHAIAYQLNNDMERQRWYDDRHLSGTGGRIQLGTNEHYDMLLYNDDTEWILFPDREEHQTNPNSDFETFNATTRTSSRTQYTRSHTGYNQPDQLFGVLLDKLYITDDPEAYTIERNEDGSVNYVYKMEATLHPYTFIYLYQVILRNNRTIEGDIIINSAKGLTANGLSSGVDLFTHRTHHSTVSLTQDAVCPLVKDYNVTLPDGTDTVADILAARILTWGMPDTAPLKVLSRSENIELADSTYVGIGLNLHNGYTYVIQRDVTQQMREHPAGGVITLIVDVTQEIPDSIINHKGGGGFQATVNQWDNETRVDITI